MPTATSEINTEEAGAGMGADSVVRGLLIGTCFVGARARRLLGAGPGKCSAE